MATSFQKLPLKVWCILAGLGASLVTTTAAQPERYEADSVYLVAPDMVKRQTGKMVHIMTTAPMVMLIADDERVTGKLTWTGHFTEDADGNFVGSGTGEIIVGEWTGDATTGYQFEPTNGKWVTHFTVRGHLENGYVGKMVAHGVEGEDVAGMVAVAEFAGAMSCGRRREIRRKPPV